MGFIEHVLGMLDEATVAMAATAFDAISAELLPVFRVMIVLSVVLLGINLMIQAIPMTLQAGVSYLFKVGLVFTFLTSWTNFNSIYGVLTNAPSEIGGTILASLGFAAASDGLYSGLDQLYEGSVNAGNAVAQNGSYIAGAISSVIVFIAAVLFAVICVVVLGLAKIVTALMIVLAPAALLCTLFRPTTGIFEGWLRVSIQAALIPMMMSAAAGVVIVIAQEVAPTDMATVSSIGDLLGFLFVMFLGAMLVTKVPDLSESMSSAGLGFASTARSVGVPIKGGSDGLIKLVASKAHQRFAASTNSSSSRKTGSASQTLATVRYLAARSRGKSLR